jgi:alkylation response protein AidB-like acyl-CoA dehydrogenase
MDLELTDEQVWLAESVETLLTRHWVSPGGTWEAGADEAARTWLELVEFGALATGPEGLGAIELCLIARALGAHLARVPFLASAALRWTLAPLERELPGAFAELLGAAASVGVAQLEPGRGWSCSEFATTVAGGTLHGLKVAVDHANGADVLAVAAAVEDESAIVLVPSTAAGVEIAPSPAFDPTAPAASVVFTGVPASADQVLVGKTALDRLQTIGALLAAAEAVGAADALMGDACRYAGERRQFGHTIGSNQALRHLLADMHVRRASSWSTVLYAAAALDGGAVDAAQTVSIAKAYVARAAREVAHGALQVFGGIGFTAEHPAHRFLRRIIVRERQFGDAREHERRLGLALAQAARRPVLAEAGR